MKHEVFRFDPGRRDDFFHLHGDSPDCGLCFCVAWHVPTWEGWGNRTAAQNRRLREELLDRGEYDGYLLYADGRPAAWCQAGPRDRLKKLTAQFGLAPDRSAWALTCFLVAPEFRRRGVCTHLLDAVLADLRTREGVVRVEAFPKRGAGLDAGELWNGPESIFEAAGFEIFVDDPRRPVYALSLNPRGD